MADKMQKGWNASNGRTYTGDQSTRTGITHEMVMAVADRVYALLIKEMKIERERNRFSVETQRRAGGL